MVNTSMGDCLRTGTLGI